MEWIFIFLSKYSPHGSVPQSNGVFGAKSIFKIHSSLSSDSDKDNKMRIIQTIPLKSISTYRKDDLP